VHVCRQACLSDQDAPVRRENLQLVTIKVHLQIYTKRARQGSRQMKNVLHVEIERKFSNSPKFGSQDMTSKTPTSLSYLDGNIQISE
jgi:hypothetical protein